MKTLLVTILLSLSSVYLYSQNSEQWVARYNGSGNKTDAVNKTEVDRFGNIYISGYTNSTGGNIDFCVLKYNSAGSLLWSRTYDGPAHSIDDAYWMTVDNDGNVYLSGRSDLNNPDMITIKFSSSGDLLWLIDCGGCIAADSYGNLFITSGNFVRKYNSLGVNQWERIYDGTVLDMTLSLSGNICFTGEVRDSTGSKFSTWKYDTSGNLLWKSTYQYAVGGDNTAIFIKTDVLENVYIAGQSTQDGINNCDLATIKYNSSGVQQWVSRYNGTRNEGEYIRGLCIDSEQSVYITGITYGIESGTDYATIKYNENGELQWCSIYNGEANDRDEVYGIAVDKESNVYITGWSSGLESMDCVTIKYNTYGVQQWKQAYHGSVTGTNCTNSIVVDSSGNVFVSGFSEGEGTQADIILIKYGNTTEVNPVSTQLPTKYSLAQNYPNPFNPNTTIEFSLPENTFVTLKIFDITGREMNTLINESMVPGSYRYNFNGLYLASGTYFYKLQTAGFTETKKMVLVK